MSATPHNPLAIALLSAMDDLEYWNARAKMSEAMVAKLAKDPSLEAPKVVDLYYVELAPGGPWLDCAGDVTTVRSEAYGWPTREQAEAAARKSLHG